MSENVVDFKRPAAVVQSEPDMPADLALLLKLAEAFDKQADLIKALARELAEAKAAAALALVLAAGIVQGLQDVVKLQAADGKDH